MLKKFLCWLIGHKRWAINSYIDKRGITCTEKTGRTFCSRCGEHLGEWWAKPSVEKLEMLKRKE